jgi:acyl carrier protein
MVAQLGEDGVKRLQAAGLTGIPLEAGLETLGHILAQGASAGPHLVAAQVDWRRLAASDPSWARRSVLRPWLAEAPAAGEGGVRAVPAELLGMAPEQRDRVLGEYVRQRVADILRLPAARVKPDVPLINQGFDSLMALELRNRIQEELGLSLPLVTFVSGPTVAGLSREAASALVAAPVPTPPAAPRPAEADRAREILERLDELSEDEIETLIEEMGGSSGG